MSAQDYYGNSASKQSYSRRGAPPPGYETASRGYAPSQSQQNYYPPQSSSSSISNSLNTISNSSPNITNNTHSSPFMSNNNRPVLEMKTV
nr:CNT_HP1_G0051680.mRNA.1.CDS.1 [Saccharomyces cerevisiae]